MVCPGCCSAYVYVHVNHYSGCQAVLHDEYLLIALYLVLVLVLLPVPVLLLFMHLSGLLSLVHQGEVCLLLPAADLELLLQTIPGSAPQGTREV